MLQTVKISSKRQITIPVDIFNYLALNEGDRLIVNIDEGKIVMEKSQKILDEMAGSLYLPKKYKDKPLEAVNQEIRIFTSTIVFFEIYWVLSSFYKKNRLKIIEYLEKILRMDFLEIENRTILQEALIIFEKHNLDLEDCYNISYANNLNADKFSTFDKKINSLLKTK